MSIEIPVLPWDRTALEPHLPGASIDLQHTHHRAHVAAINALAPAEGLASAGLDEIVRQAQGPLQAHAAQAWNLAFQWRCLKPAAAGGGGEPHDELAEAIRRRFGDFARFRKQFAATATTLQGSGWIWLLQRPGGALAVALTRNTASPITGEDRPLLGLNLWEHAFVLDYREARDRYLDALWNVVDWGFVASNLK